MFEPEVHAAPPIATEDARRRARSVAVALGQLTLALTVGLAALGGCAIPFGSGPESTDSTPQETRRDRNRLYLEEQESIERGRAFDRVGPSDR